MADLTNEEQEQKEKQARQQKCKLMSNAEYQKVVPILMNLAAASLAVPVLLAKEFHPLNPAGKVDFPRGWAVGVWVLFVLSLACGCAFHYSSAKFVKALYGGYEGKATSRLDRVFLQRLSWGDCDSTAWQECSYEHLRDGSILGLLLFFFLGIGCLVGFMVPYFKALSPHTTGILNGGF